MTKTISFPVSLGAWIIPFALLTSACSSLTGGTQDQATTAPAAPTPAPANQPPNTSASAGPSVAAPAASTPVGATQPAPIASGDFRTAVRQVATNVRPSVVQITSEQTQASQFNQPYAVPTGVGSGVIYDAQGHILTNNHVVAGAQQIQIALPDGRSFQGTLVGADPQTDLAVVQISGADNLPVAPLGDSSQLEVGDWVVAIGNALALEGGPTVTAGLVSALNRAVQEPPDQTPSPSPSTGRGGGGGSGGLSVGNTGTPGPFLFGVIQTDAPINPGNSGGPLLNLDGQVVGINTLVAGQAEPGVQAQGIGFAISLAVAKPVADQLIATGRVVHPFLGISYVPLNAAIASRLGIATNQQGAALQAVNPGSPAATAGLQANDVITAVDGTPLQGDSALAQALNGHKPGDTVTLTILRRGQTQTVQATLGQAPAS